MRTISLDLFPFSELPTDKAKEKAREWGRRILNDNPPWLDEYQDAARAINKLDGYSLKEKAAKWDTYPLTGFCADECLKVILDMPEDTSTDELQKAAIDELNKLWEWEVESMNTDEYIDDFLEANGYEFTSDGKTA